MYGQLSMNTAYKDEIQTRMQDRATQVLAMRNAGRTFKAIAAELGISEVTAIADRNRALAALVKDTQVEAAEYRDLLTSRLEEQYAALEDAKDHKSIELKLKIIDKLAALYGLTVQQAPAGDTNNLMFVLNFGAAGAPAGDPVIPGSARRVFADAAQGRYMVEEPGEDREASA